MCLVLFQDSRVLLQVEDGAAVDDGEDNVTLSKLAATDPKDGALLAKPKRLFFLIYNL